MRRLILITILLTSCTVFAASQKLQELPLIQQLHDDSRVYVYDVLSGNRNITGAKLKSEINTNPILRAPLGNYSSTTYTTYSSASGRAPLGNYSSTTYTTYSSASGRAGTKIHSHYNRVHLFFRGQTLTIRPVAE